jgi:hypothetical protein
MIDRPPPMRGLRLIAGLMLVTLLVLPAAYVAALLGTGAAPARDLLFLIFYVAIATTLSANAAIAFTLSLTAMLGTIDQPVATISPQPSARESLPSKARQLAQQDTLPPPFLVAMMLAPLAVLLLGFGAWLCTTLYRDGSSLLFLALTAVNLIALSAALLALAFLASMLFLHRAKKAAAETPDV